MLLIPICVITSCGSLDVQKDKQSVGSNVRYVGCACTVERMNMEAKFNCTQPLIPWRNSNERGSE